MSADFFATMLFDRWRKHVDNRNQKIDPRINITYHERIRSSFEFRLQQVKMSANFRWFLMDGGSVLMTEVEKWQ